MTDISRRHLIQTAAGLAAIASAQSTASIINTITGGVKSVASGLLAA